MTNALDIPSLPNIPPPPNPSHIGDGWTKWHEDAKNGIYLPVEQIVELGNPSDCRGLTIADVMMLNGYQFADDEEKKLGIDHANFEYTAYASYQVPFNSKDPFLPRPTICPKCESKFNGFSVEPYEYYKFYNFYDIRGFYCEKCLWWCIREICEGGGIGEGYPEDDRLIVGVAKSKINSTHENNEPWKKVINNDYAFLHPLIMKDDLLKMFL